MLQTAFSVLDRSTLHRRNLKTQQSPAILYLCLRKNIGREITWLLRCHRFRKTPFSKCFPSTLKSKAESFQIHPVWTPFSKSRSVFVTVSVDGRRSERYQASFQISSAQYARGSVIGAASVIRNFCGSQITLTIKKNRKQKDISHFLWFENRRIVNFEVLVCVRSFFSLPVQGTLQVPRSGFLSTTVPTSEIHGWKLI